jgi:heme/copper-type cytochrome/quinol oxidase subunit 2
MQNIETMLMIAALVMLATYYSLSPIIRYFKKRRIRHKYKLNIKHNKPTEHVKA